MRADLIRVDTKSMTQAEWLEFRRKGIGGSEMATIMGMSPYSSSIELFYSKLKPAVELDENEAMHWGKALEDLIAERWQYWDSDPLTMIKNYKDSNIVRKCRSINAYLINPAYPHLYISIDRLINKTDKAGEGVLEIKNISGFVARMWEGGIPPGHVIQLQDYLLVTGLDHGELAILKDGRYMQVYEFKKSEKIQEAIIEKSTDFWSRVKRATEIMISDGIGNYDYLTKQSSIAEINSLEPAPDGSEAYEQFISDRFKAKILSISGTQEMFNHCVEYNKFKAAEKASEDQMRLHSNCIKAYMKEAEEMTFGSSGKVTWKENSNKSRIFKVNIKTV